MCLGKSAQIRIALPQDRVTMDSVVLQEREREGFSLTRIVRMDFLDMKEDKWDTWPSGGEVFLIECISFP